MSPRAELDLRDVRSLVGEAVDLARRLDGASTAVSTAKSAEKAQVTRDLGRLTNLLELAAAEVTNQTYLLRGYDDPRDEDI